MPLQRGLARCGARSRLCPPGEGGRDVQPVLSTGAQKGEIDFVYLLGADEFDVGHLSRAFIVYQGSHGDAGAHNTDVFFQGNLYRGRPPPSCWGRVQRTETRAFPRAKRRRTGRSFCVRYPGILGSRLPRRQSRPTPRDPSLAQSTFRKDIGEDAGSWRCPDAAMWNTGQRLSDGPLGSRVPFGSARCVVDYYLTNPSACEQGDGAVGQEFVTGAQGVAAGRHALHPLLREFDALSLGVGAQPGISHSDLPRLPAGHGGVHLLCGRKIFMAVQMRRGRAVVGIFGLLQSFARPRQSSR